MAFETYDQNVTAGNQALSLVNQIRSLYYSAKQVKEKLELYQAGTDPKFNQAINTVYPAEERAIIGSMLSQIATLLAAWESNEGARQALGLPPL